MLPPSAPETKKPAAGAARGSFRYFRFCSFIGVLPDVSSYRAIHLAFQYFLSSRSFMRRLSSRSFNVRVSSRSFI